LAVTVTDLSTSSESAPTQVTVDQSVPAAPVITGPAEGTVTNDNTPTVTGRAEAGATVNVTGP